VKEGPRNKKQRGIWKKTIDDEIKIIDFGGATYANEHHTALINTRQYRAPEVILGKVLKPFIGILNLNLLGCSKWDEKSDIWSLACIFAELYTGEMFFPTHENIEHLALMEKTCGPLPYWMASNAKDEFKQCFDLKRSEETIQTRKMRLKWPEAAKKKDSYNNWLD